MTRPEDLDARLVAAEENYATRRALLEAAIEHQATTTGRLGSFVATRVVRHHERALFDSDQNLGMIAAMKALREGASSEEVMRSLES